MPQSRPAPTAPLLVIDLQTGMFDGVMEPPIHDAVGLVERVRRAIDWARRTNRKVAFIRHDGSAGDPLAPNAPGWPVWPALGQAADEPTFSKRIGDAFSNPDLVDWINDQAAGEVILVGTQTDQCVAATLQGARQAGLAVTVIADAHGTWPFGGETAVQIIERHNRLFEAEGANLMVAASLS